MGIMEAEKSLHNTPNLLPVLKKAGVFNYNGSTKINSTRLVTEASFLSDIGSIDALLTINDYTDVDRATYVGNLMFSKFDIPNRLWTCKDPSISEVDSFYPLFYFRSG